MHIRFQDSIEDLSVDAGRRGEDQQLKPQKLHQIKKTLQLLELLKLCENKI